MPRPSPAVFISVASLALAQPAFSAPRDAAPQEMAAAFSAMLATDTGAEIEGDMAQMVAAFQQRPEIANLAPAAFTQAARLAISAAHPASRGVFYDIARNIAETGAAMSGENAPDMGVIALWNQQDPMIHQIAPGVGISMRDVAAFDALRDLARRDGVLDRPDKPREIIEAFWRSHQDRAADLMIPGFLTGWSEGAIAAWPGLTPGERAQAVHVIDAGEAPTRATYQKITGTAHVIMWLGSVEIAMSPAEREHSPELIELMDMAAFAGPLRQPIIDSVQMQAIGGLGAQQTATEQLQRLNEWSAITGENGGWDAHRHMSQDR